MDMQAFNEQIIEEFRANSGKVAMFAEHPMVILHTVGAMSGSRHSAHRMKNHHRVLCEHGHFPAVRSELLNNLLIKRLHIHARHLDLVFD